MNHNVDHIDDLIGKYLAGEAAKDEVLFIESWIQKDEANRKHLDQCKLIFDKSYAAKSLQVFDTDAAWLKIKSKLQTGTKVVPLHGRKGAQQFWLGIAASVIVVLGVSFFCLSMDDFQCW